MKNSSMKRLAIALGLSVLLSGCGQYATEGAAKSGATGAASGAVGGMVTALIFGGDPIEAAARGAVYAGAASATAGAISGSQKDAKIKEQRKVKADKIRAEIGDDAFKGLSALMHCDYADTLEYAQKSRQSNNPNFAVTGYWLEVLSYADQGNDEMTTQLLPGVVTKDWNTNNEADARTHVNELQGQLAAGRKEYKLPETCK